MNERTLAQQLGDFATGQHVKTLPDDVVDSVGMRVLDTLGIAVGASTLETSAAARAWVLEYRGTPHATAIGLSDRLPAALAAFVNGVNAHSLDYDDTHLPSVLHPSASVVPAALAAAEQAGADGAELVRAVAVGLEVCVRLGMAGYDPATGNSIFFEHGQHATSICGAMGAAVAAAMLRGASAREVTDVLGVAASMAAGIIEANRTGGTVKRMHCGWAAHAGVSAAGLVAHGVTGPPTVLEGRFGFFQAWLHTEGNAEEVVGGLGETWSVPGIFFKPYPANHFTHAAVDAAAALREQGIRPADIDQLVLGVPAPNLRTIGEPIEVKRAPETGYMAQFSGPYAVTVGLLGGSGLGASLADYTDELAQDPERRALMQKIDVVPDDRCTEIFPHQFPAVLTARLHDGREVVQEVLTTRGGPERPLSFEEISAKFHDNVEPVLSREEADALAEACRVLPDLDDLSAVTTPLAGAARHLTRSESSSSTKGST